MWRLFLKDCVFFWGLLLIPGFCISLPFSKKASKSLLTAPLYSIGAAYFFSFCLRLLNISTSWFGIVAGVVLIAVASLVVSINKHPDLSIPMADFAPIAFCVMLAALIAGYVYIKPLDSAVSFMQGYDNYYHLYQIRDFLNTGFYSSGSLLAYPTEWHGLCALVAAFGNSEVTVAANVVNFTLVALVFPLAACFLMTELFPDSDAIRWALPFVVLANTGLPWPSIAYGPLYAFLMGFCVLPYGMTYFINVTDNCFQNRFGAGVAQFCISLFVLVAAHQSMVFIAVLLLTPKLLSSVWCAASKINRITAFCVSSVVCALIVFGWRLCYGHPAFAPVVFFVHGTFYSSATAIANTLISSLCVTDVPQILIAVLTLIGGFSLLSDKRHRWLLWSFVFAGFTYAACVGVSSSLGHFITGFWYNDHNRTAEVFALSALPLITLGFSKLLLFGKAFLETYNLDTRLGYAGCGLVTLFLLFTPSFSWGPGVTVQTPFSNLRERLTQYYSLEDNAMCLTLDELAFLQKVKAYVGDDPVINYPFDGSCFAYGTSDLSVVNHKWWGYEEDNLEMRYIRAHIMELTTDVNEINYLNKEGIKYVLLLDRPSASDATLMKLSYVPEEWTEFEQISDETQGLEIVYAENDMRLYKIQGVE